MDEPFNSSDIEFEEPQEATNARRPGQASIEAIIENAVADRISSKRTDKLLKFGYGSPGHLYLQQLWVNRFEAFREHTLKQSTKTPFNSHDLLRFLDAIIPKLKIVDKNKPGPNQATIVPALTALLEYGRFHWSKTDGFDIGSHDTQRFKAFLAQACRENRITKGQWREKVWIGFVTMSRLIKIWFDHFTEQGTADWDVIITKALSMVLLSALNARSGDVVRSNRWKGEQYLQWRHIKISIQKGEATFSNLTMAVTLEFTKGHKDIKTANFTRYISAIDNIDFTHICPVALLLIAALRTGQVYGNTLNEVLLHTASKPDRTIVWKNPNFPVIPRLNKQKGIDLEFPATSGQNCNTAKEMGLVAGFLDRCHPHAFRLGAARDISHLPKTTKNVGVVRSEVQQALGHPAGSKAANITAAYIGDPTREWYNDRVSSPFIHPRSQPRFSQTPIVDQVRSPVPLDDVKQWLKQNEPEKDWSDDIPQLKRLSVRAAIRRQRHQELIASTPANLALGETPGKLVEQSDSQINSIAGRMLKRKNAFISPNESSPPISRSSKANIRVQRQEDDIQEGEIDQSDNSTLVHTKRKRGKKGSLSKSTSLIAESPNSTPLALGEDDEAAGQRSDLGEQPTVPEKGDALMDISVPEPYSNIDPRLLDEDQLKMVEVDATKADALVSSLFVGDDDETDPSDSELRAMRDMAKELTHGTGNYSLCSDLVPEDFIDFYSRMNVVKNESFARYWNSYNRNEISFDKSLGLYSKRGNSRDHPTPFFFRCTKNSECEFSTLIHAALIKHETTPSACPTKRLPEYHCSYGICKGLSFPDDETLREHLLVRHKWIPRSCGEEGCKYSDRPYYTKQSYKEHYGEKHSDTFPCKCPHPHCTSETKFTSRKGLNTHLQRLHNLTREESKAYLPDRPMQRYYEPGRCPYLGCSSEVIWSDKSNMVRHIENYHPLTKIEAIALVDANAMVTRNRIKRPKKGKE